MFAVVTGTLLRSLIRSIGRSVAGGRISAQNFGGLQCWIVVIWRLPGMIVARSPPLRGEMVESPGVDR